VKWKPVKTGKNTGTIAFRFRQVLLYCSALIMWLSSLRLNLKIDMELHPRRFVGFSSCMSYLYNGWTDLNNEFFISKQINVFIETCIQKRVAYEFS
jgi:hypothetical protein